VNYTNEAPFCYFLQPLVSVWNKNKRNHIRNGRKETRLRSMLFPCFAYSGTLNMEAVCS
jgi:hypothetical protein